MSHPDLKFMPGDGVVRATDMRARMKNPVPVDDGWYSTIRGEVTGVASTDGEAGWLITVSFPGGRSTLRQADLVLVDRHSP